MNYEEKKKIIADACHKILLHKVAMVTAIKTNASTYEQRKLADEFLKIHEPIFAMYVEELNKVINPVNPILLPLMLAVFTSVTKTIESQCTEEDRRLSNIMQQSITSVAVKFNPEDFKK